MKFINLPLFIISLSIGLFVNYITDPNTKTVFVYPTPDNYHQLQYKGKDDTCFGFTPKEVKCPTDEKDIEPYAVAERF